MTVLQFPKFKAEATALIGTDGIEAVAAYLMDHPDAENVEPRAGGPRKLRWGAKGKVKRGGTQIIYFYAQSDARIYLLGCIGEKRRKSRLI
jgi:hypothetical protein